MKILLTTPPEPPSSILPERYQGFAALLDLLGGKRPILGMQPPYGLLYLAAALRRAGHEVRVVDGLRSERDTILEMTADGVELVGISTVTLNWSRARELARVLRARFPRVKLAVGGAHVNAVRGAALEECAELDYAFYGDAEETFCALAAALAAGAPPPEMVGVARREGERVLASAKRSIIRDADSIAPPDRDELGLEHYRPSPQSYRKLPFAAVFGSRGCPGSCTFCHSDARARIRSAANIVDELEHLRDRHGVREVLFYDENLTLDRDRVLELCELLRQRRVELSWSANARVDTVDAEMLRAMKRAGCWRLLLGLESGSQRILDRVRKGITVRQIRDGVAMIRAAGIQTYGMFVFGFPTESYAEGMQTIELMKSLELDFVNVASMTPFPGTKIYEEVAGESGFRGFDAMNMYDIAYVPASMTVAELEDLLRRSLREFYLRPSYVARQIANVEGLSDLVRYARGSAIVLLR